MAVLILSLGMTVVVQAALIVQEPVPGEFFVLDEDTNLMWLQDANYAQKSGCDPDGSMLWDVAVAWADGLSYAGYDDWRLPSALNSDGSGPCYGYNGNDSEMGHLYYDEGITRPSQSPFTQLAHTYYWTGTEYAADPNRAWVFGFHDGAQYTSSKFNNYYTVLVLIRAAW